MRENRQITQTKEQQEIITNWYFVHFFMFLFGVLLYISYFCTEFESGEKDVADYEKNDEVFADGADGADCGYQRGCRA